MRLLLAGVCALALFVSPARAEDEFTLKLTARDLEVIATALGEAPFKIVEPVVNKLRIQIRSQGEKKPDDKVEPEKKGDQP